MSGPYWCWCDDTCWRCADDRLDIPGDDLADIEHDETVDEPADNHGGGLMMRTLNLPALIDGQTVYPVAEPLWREHEGTSVIYGPVFFDLPYAGRVDITVPCPHDCQRFGGKVPGYQRGSNWDWVPCWCGGTGEAVVASADVEFVPIVGDGVIADALTYVEVVDGGEVYMWTWDDEKDDHVHGDCLFDDIAWEAHRDKWAAVLSNIEVTA